MIEKLHSKTFSVIDYIIWILVWVVSSVLNISFIIFAILNIYRYQIIIFYAVYYSYRYFNPRKTWKAFRKLQESR